MPQISESTLFSEQGEQLSLYKLIRISSEKRSPNYVDTSAARNNMLKVLKALPSKHSQRRGVVAMFHPSDRDEFKAACAARGSNSHAMMRQFAAQVIAEYREAQNQDAA